MNCNSALKYNNKYKNIGFVNAIAVVTRLAIYRLFITYRRHFPQIKTRDGKSFSLLPNIVTQYPYFINPPTQ